MFALLLSLVSVCSSARAAGLEYLNDALTYNQILAIGESFHERPDLVNEVHNLILSAAAKDAEWIGLEVSSDYQDEIDAYLAGKVQLPGDWSADNKTLLKRIRELNRRQYKTLRVLALDLPVTPGAAEGDWFLARDPHMYRTLKAASENFAKPGILFMGMGHLSKTPFRLPRIATLKMSLENESSLATLGSLLDATPELEGQVLTVAVHAGGSWIERWSQLPPDYRALYAFMSGSPPGVLADLKSDMFHRREQHEDGDFPVRLSEAFDYLINVPTKRSAFQECQAALAAPSLLLRGAVLKAMDAYARFKK